MMMQLKRNADVRGVDGWGGLKLACLMFRFYIVAQRVGRHGAFDFRGDYY